MLDMYELKHTENYEIDDIKFTIHICNVGNDRLRAYVLLENIKSGEKIKIGTAEADEDCPIEEFLNVIKKELKQLLEKE